MNFVYHLLGTHATLKPKVKNFFSEITSGKMTGITSTFTKAEYVGVVKEIYSEKQKATPNSLTINTIEKTFDGFIKKMGIIVYDSDSLTNSSFFNDCYSHIKNADAIKRKSKKWKMIGGADSILLLFAEKTNADLIATNDDGFKGIKSTTVKPLMVREVY